MGASTGAPELILMTLNFETLVNRYVQAKPLARGTRGEYACTLRKWKQWDRGVPIQDLSRVEIREFLDWVYRTAVENDGTNPGRTSNKAREHLRAVLAWAWEHDVMESLPRFPRPRPQRDVTGRHYLTKGWRHVLPDTSRAETLTAVSDTLADFDVVALQECDAGSLRSGYLNQVQYLAQKAAFPYAVSSPTRNWYPLAQHCNGLLSRREPLALEEHALPGRLPGRAALSARLPFAEASLLLIVLHLSLGARSRQRQLAYVAQLLAGERYAVLIGDLNSSVEELMGSPELSTVGLVPLSDSPASYPAWRPTRAIDHIVGTHNLKIENYRALRQHASDHRPVAAQVCPR